MSKVLCCSLVFGFLTIVHALDNGLAKTPPMGWLSWTAFKCQTDCVKYPNACINEKLYMDMADAMVSEGYKDAGYEFVNIDDCWSNKQRDRNNRLVADNQRFSHGIKYLADYMHNKGLKLGIYCDYGTKTCGGYPGSIDYLEIDAKTFANWEVDMLKMDGCYANVSSMPSGYAAMGKYLNETGRSIVYSCSEPAYEVGEGVTPDYQFLAKHCNLWRNYNDIDFKWSIVQDIINWYDQHLNEMIPANGPGHWNDPDMIIGGGPNLSLDQAKAQMAIWSIWSAPLLLSVDLRNVSDEFKAVLQNKKVIAIDQDPLGNMGRLVYNDTDFGIYVKAVTPFDSSTGEYSQAVVIYNRASSDKYMTVKLADIGLTAKQGYKVEELFVGAYYGHMFPKDSMLTYLKPTSVSMLKCTLIDDSVQDS